MIFYSQQNEDKILFEKYLNYKNGFFIELGAMDGITYSNTCFFESHLDWSGILIEPNMDFNLSKNKRKNSYCYNCAISNKNGQVEFLNAGPLGGIKELMDDKHIEGWQLNGLKTNLTESRTLKNIIEEVKSLNNNFNRIDFLSLDVEGGEFEVLESYDWNIPTYIILIEMSSHNLEKNEKCKNLLKKNGFEFDMVIGCNEVWINHVNKPNE